MIRRCSTAAARKSGALTGWRDFGLVPHFPVVDRLPAEDALGLEAPRAKPPGAKARVVVLAYPRIANFDDFDPLRLEPDVDVEFLTLGQPIPADADLAILPGSKATIADLNALRACGWEIDIKAHVRRGGLVLGICGGYQMLGQRVSDPAGIEGPPSECQGLGLLEVETQLGGDKLLREASGACVAAGAPFAAMKCTSAARRVPIAHGRCCASATAATTARPAPMVASAAATCTGCSPTMRNARPGCGGSAPGAPASTTRR